jgi:NADPH-dependent 7-cyano-7-deazaguanine reductase QueF
VNITITGQVTKLCPFVDESDDGTVRITLNADAAPELHGLRAYLDTFAGVPLSHEEFTRRLAADYPGAEVESTWHTAGLEVTCRAVSGERVE